MKRRVIALEKGFFRTTANAPSPKLVTDAEAPAPNLCTPQRPLPPPVVPFASNAASSSDVTCQQLSPAVRVASQHTSDARPPLDSARMASQHTSDAWPPSNAAGQLLAPVHVASQLGSEARSSSSGAAVRASGSVRVASQHVVDAWSSSIGAAVQDGSCSARGEMMRAQHPVLTAQNPGAYSQIPSPVLASRTCGWQSIAAPSSPIVASRTCSRQSIGPSSPALVSRTCSRQSVGPSSPALVSHRCSTQCVGPSSPWITPRAVRATLPTGRP